VLLCCDFIDWLLIVLRPATNMLMLIWDDERIQKYMKNITYRNKEGMERLKQGQKVHCN
jgi:hypothetical protein